MPLSYFAQFNSNTGNEELWLSDGTVAGTHLVKSFANAGSFTQMTMIGARAFFVINDGVHGNELWTSDGTASGTVLLKDINPGLNSSDPINLIDLNGTLLFTAFDPVHGNELWRSDGTAAGIMLVKDIAPGSGSSLQFSPSSMIVVNGTLFFQADDSGTGANKLWKSDGAAAGTVLVKDVSPGIGTDFDDFTNVNGTVFFEAFDAAHGTELWKTDGTAAGTVLVKDIRPGTGSSSPFFLTNLNGTLFFEADDGVHGEQLWKSDGSAAGTVMVTTINPGNFFPQFLTTVNGTLFFAANDGVHGNELWKSDGTSAGTVMVKDITPGTGGIGPQSLINVGGMLFFADNDGVHGNQLWKSDGTDAGTVMLTTINVAGGGLSPEELTNVNGILEFYGNDGIINGGLFRSDGTAAGTFELANNSDFTVPIGVMPLPTANDFDGDRVSDILWRNTSGGLADWTMFRGSITSSGFVTSGGAVVAPGATWSVAGISDFNGDGNADVLWRNTDGTLATWIMNGSTIMSSNVVTAGGVAVKPDASWSVAGVGDFDGDSRSDILWRNADGTLAEWTMNGSTITSSGFVTAGGVAVKPDASWIVAGVGDFNSDNRKDMLWRSTSGEVAVWFMNGAAITGSGDLTSGGVAVKPDATWSIAGVGDINRDGFSDVIWRNGNGSLAVWLMNGSTIAGSGAITSGGAPVAPDAAWHVVEIGDFNGDNNADILWRNDNGSMAEWLMNGTAISQSVTPTSGGAAVSPDASWSTQAKPTNFG